MSLASVGQFACALQFIVSAAGIFYFHSGASLAERSLDRNEQWILVSIALLGLGAKILALARLRSVGKLLHCGTTISHEMATAWRRCGQAIVAAGVLVLLPVQPARGPAGSLNIAAGLDAGGIYFLLIAGLCAFSISKIVADAAALKDENQSIV